MSFRKWLFYMICHGICSNKSFFYHVATCRRLSPWPHFPSGGVWGGEGSPFLGWKIPFDPQDQGRCDADVLPPGGDLGKKAKQGTFRRFAPHIQAVQ